MKYQKNEGRYNNVSGDMFELLVGSHFSRLVCNFLHMEEENFCEETGRKKEIDLRILKDGKWIIVECKATKSKIYVAFIKNG